ncbi:hypothetical protein PV325_008918 [Microctonus aethiopoides]|uniref:Ionotropic receptor n=1 Tax=Microctonus aethiopoides TaxID=144406 RepID=A0AA39KQJ9_9HYME|nr:hypothetical protein PV325_008918 [Microctonus aethiopoides]KAK0170067.1 hypothetical protein PV328_010672 [Microctonus aethiopoides]
MNLLSSLFFCVEENKRIMIYTFNPYTNRAPYPWRQVNYYSKLNNRWTLYAQKYFEDKNNCDNLIYDKTKFMDGYKIKAVANAKPKTKWIKNKNYNINSLIEKNPSIEDAFFSNHLFTALNITVIINYDYTGYFENKTPVGYLKSLIEGTHDISLSYRTPILELKSTYPLIQTSMRILTQQRKFLLPEEKILKFYSSEIFYLTAIVLLMTLIVMMATYEKKKFTSGAFDILRLLLSTTINMPFKTISIRIYFIGIFQLIIILNATFQGNLSAFLTKSERHNIDCIRDLVLYNYNIYAPIVQKKILERYETEFVKGINYVPGLDCGDYIVNDSSAACIEMTHRGVDTAEKNGFHISHSNVAEEYVSYWCRFDWPLIEKINFYSFRFIEAGLYKFWRNHKLLIPIENLRTKEAKEIATKLRPIKLNDLKFAFRLLAIGLGVSSLVFMVEILTWNKFLRFVKKIKCFSEFFDD